MCSSGAMAQDREAVLQLHSEMQQSGLQDDDVTLWQLKQARGLALGGSRSSFSSSRYGAEDRTYRPPTPSSSYQPKWKPRRSDIYDERDGARDGY